VPENPTATAVIPGPKEIPSETGVGARTLGRAALVGASGSILLALATDLPGSPFGAHAGGLWPLAAAGPAPSWEGPTLPSWARLADQAPGVETGRILPTLLVLAGLGLLVAAWVLVWRRARAPRPPDGPRLALVVGAWVAPLLLAAPFASQDVWHYGAEGKMVLDGFGGYRPASLLGHSVWTLAVDGKWATRPPLYGPAALDLSAFFVKISGGRPWLAAECWRLAAIIGLVLGAWGVARIVSLRGGDTTAAALAGLANPAVLLILVGGIHNDALMLGLAVAGIALALSGRHWWGLVLAALAVSVKPNALLVVAVLVWWASGDRWRARAGQAVTAAAALVGVLVVTGLGVGGGFGWLRPLVHYRWVPGPWSIAYQAFGVASGWPVTTIELTGLALAVVLILGVGRRREWIAALGWGFAVLAVTTPTPEPWYLAWAVVILASGGLGRRSERVGVLVLTVMMLGSLVPPGPLWWFSGLVVLGWLGATAIRTRFSRPRPVAVGAACP
jgi:hypothetical protein